MGKWTSLAATLAVGVIGLSLFLNREQSPPPEIPTQPTATVYGAHPDATLTAYSATDWERLAAACRLDPAAARMLPTRARPGAPLVQVFSSADDADAARELFTFADRGAFILPVEADGQVRCTVVLGPFATQEEAERTAAELSAAGVEAKVSFY